MPIAAILTLLEAAVSETPALIDDLKNIFSKPNPTPADWEALRQKVRAKTYADYVSSSALPGSGSVTVVPDANTAATESNAPISQPGASETAQTAVADQNQAAEASTSAAAAAPVAAEPAYLPDGSPNPAYNHLG